MGIDRRCGGRRAGRVDDSRANELPAARHGRGHGQERGEIGGKSAGAADHEGDHGVDHGRKALIAD